VDDEVLVDELVVDDEVLVDVLLELLDDVTFASEQRANAP
jgi:hypothetical protein